MRPVAPVGNVVGDRRLGYGGSVHGRANSRMRNGGALATMLQLRVILSIGVTVLGTVVAAAMAAEPSSLPAPPRFVPPRAGTAPVESPGAIRFVTTDDFPPFGFVDGAGALTGFDVELARAICRRLAVPCTIQVRPFPLLVDALVTNTADAALGGVRDTPRLRRFAAHTARYLRLPARFVTRRADVVDARPETLAGRVVAVARETRTADFLVDFFPETKRIEVDDDAAALAAVKEGRADAAFVGALGASFWLAGPASADCCAFAGGAWTEPAYFGDGPSIAVRADDRRLRAALDDALRGLDADGTLADLTLRFFPVGLY